MRTAAIVGSGLIGQGWAIVFARAGWRVKLYDRSPDAAKNGLAMVVSQLAMLKKQGMLDDERKLPPA